MDPASRLQTLVFDLDGTLTDPYVGMSRSYVHALKTIGLPPLSESELRGLIGPPMQVTFATLCGGNAELVPAAIAAYRERYSRIGLFENVVYPGIREALQVLGRSYELFVCTAKPLAFAKRILHASISPTISLGIYGSELDGTRADKRDLLRWLLERERIVPRGAAAIGDRKYDITAALVNGLTPVGVLWGFGKSTAKPACTTPRPGRRPGSRCHPEQRRRRVVEGPASILRDCGRPSTTLGVTNAGSGTRVIRLLLCHPEQRRRRVVEGPPRSCATVAAPRRRSG